MASFRQSKFNFLQQLSPLIISSRTSKREVLPTFIQMLLKAFMHRISNIQKVLRRFAKQTERSARKISAAFLPDSERVFAASTRSANVVALLRRSKNLYSCRKVLHSRRFLLSFRQDEAKDLSNCWSACQQGLDGNKTRW